MDIMAEIANLPEFEKVMRQSVREVKRGMWHGTRRGIAAYRRTFLDKATADSGIRPGSRRNPRGAGNPRGPLGSKFRWEVFPKNPDNRRDSLHVTASSNVRGELYTFAKPADYLENPQTIRPKRKFLAIPLRGAGKPNTARLRSGERHPRVKPNWKDPKTARDKNPNYRFWFVNRGTYRLVYAKRVYRSQRRNANSRPFVAFILVPRINMRTNFLEFISGFENFRPEIVRRFREELVEALKRAVRV